MPPAELVIKGLKKGDRSREEDPVLSHSSGTLAHMGTIGTVHDFKSFNRLRAIAVKSRNQNQNSNNSNNNNNNNVNNNSISIGSNINGRSSGNSTTNINNSTSTSGAALNNNNQKQMQQMKQMNNTLNNKSSRGQIKLNENTRDSMNAKFGSLLRGIQPVSIVKLRQQHDLGSFTDPVHR
jgi:hypothetical protein